MKLHDKYKIKINEDVKIIYHKTKNVLFIWGTKRKIIINLKFKILFLKDKKTIFVTNKISNNSVIRHKKILNAIRRSYVIFLKQQIIETQMFSHRNIKLVGVGYKAIPIVKPSSTIIKLKLGYSHLIFFKINLKKINITCFKSTNLHIAGHSNTYVSQIASKLRSYKKPEPYKGKGFLYKDEKIILKEGKKI